jgi:predicted HD phosphohydrolase
MSNILLGSSLCKVGRKNLDLMFMCALAGKKGQSEVLVQGGVLEDLGKHLVQHYGIPKKHIEILDKTKKV